MHILIAPDKFKDALSAEAAARAIKSGILKAMPAASCTLLPLADGGEGTAALLTQYVGGTSRHSLVYDPLYRPANASWGYQPTEKHAYIELAAASGLALLPPALRNPLYTSTYGTGQLIAEALAAGAQAISLGLGGSATNDGGSGMAAALGFRFYSAGGKLLARPTGQDLLKIGHIDQQQVNPLLSGCSIQAACDVNNPLTGPTGAAHTFASQKGANDQEIAILEEGLCRLEELIKTELGLDLKHKAGSGAAGGAGAGVLAFLGGSLRNGADLILAASRFSEKLQQADLLVTGEGRIDASSLQGKLLSSLCQQAQKSGKKVIAFCGSSNLSAAEARKAGIHALIPVSGPGEPLESALRNTAKNLEQAAQRYFSTFAKANSD